MGGKGLTSTTRLLADPNSIVVVETRRSQLTIRVWPVWVPAESRANRMLRNGQLVAELQ